MKSIFTSISYALKLESIVFSAFFLSEETEEKNCLIPHFSCMGDVIFACSDSPGPLSSQLFC